MNVQEPSEKVVADTRFPAVLERPRRGFPNGRSAQGKMTKESTPHLLSLCIGREGRKSCETEGQRFTFARALDQGFRCLGDTKGGQGPDRLDTNRRGKSTFHSRLAKGHPGFFTTHGAQETKEADETRPRLSGFASRLHLSS